MAAEWKPKQKDDTTSPVQDVGSEPVSTTDKGSDSALGGKSAKRSGAESAPNPAEERSA